MQPAQWGRCYRALSAPTQYYLTRSTVGAAAEEQHVIIRLQYEDGWRRSPMEAGACR